MEERLIQLSISDCFQIRYAASFCMGETAQIFLSKLARAMFVPRQLYLLNR
jgi:hypothetical protein